MRILRPVVLSILALAAAMPAQVGIIPSGCPSFPGFSGTGGGSPKIGNASFRISPLPPCASGEVALDLLGVLPTVTLQLNPPIGCELGCQVVGNPVVILAGISGSFAAPIPNNQALIGVTVWYQHGCQRPSHPTYPMCAVFNGGLSIKIMP
ncbi:MAG: hypothetical protein KDC87_12185 [Planctomycetes bacterium]|nr:hypothetical protein [Planctomycetota bacterium]